MATSSRLRSTARGTRLGGKCDAGFAQARPSGGVGWLPQADARIWGLLWPLLAHVTGPAGAEGGALLEEALRLLSAALAACPALPPELAVRRLPQRVSTCAAP